MYESIIAGTAKSVAAFEHFAYVRYCVTYVTKI